MPDFSGTLRGRIVLGREVAKGGEGRIHEIQGDPASLAKIYLQPPSSNKIAKLQAMLAALPSVSTGLTAWPCELILSGTKVVGFVMNRIADKQDAHYLYSPKSRAAAFPEANFKFLVSVSANLASAFGSVHELGVVIGDVNHGSTLVGSNSTVSLIDADSFQFTSAGRTHFCDVGSPLYLPPELQSVALRGRLRDPQSDYFGLAVLLFHLLYMGRHPFAGIYSGPEEMPIEKAIAQGRFAYGGDSARLRMKRPPGTLKLDAHGPQIAALFERAFAAPAQTPSRPSPREWVAALKALSEALKTCTDSSVHHYSNHLNKCPWCEIEAAAPIRLFGHKITSAPSSATNVEALWSAIAAVHAPPPATDPRSRDYRPAPVPANKPSRSIRKAAAIVIAIVGFAAYQVGGLIGGAIVAALIWPRIDAAKLAAATTALDIAKSRSLDMWVQWDDKAKSKEFERKREALEKSAKALRHLPTERSQALQSLDVRKRELQLLKFLDRFEISNANIALIGPSRAATLASHGIETAADVEADKIESIAGFGPRMRANLVEWRDKQKRQFRYDASQPTDPRDIADVERRIHEKQVKLINELAAGPNQLRRLAAETMDARRRLLPALEQALLAEDQAYRAIVEL